MRTGILHLSCIAVLLLPSCGRRPPAATLDPRSVETDAELVERGRYLVRDVAVCGHCHAADPAQPDGPLSGGLAFSSWRLGTVRASNLTPDPATGLGAWTDAEIVRAIRNGVGRHGHVLAPVMPYAWFRGMSERDALAIARYLRTLEPVVRRVRQNHNLIYAIGEVVFLRPARASRERTPPAGPTVEYGEYLSNHVALCADCHTPRGGLLNRPRLDRLFAGDADPPDGFPANPSNLTPHDDTGIGLWSEQDFMRALREGEDPEGREIHPFMPWQQLRRMTDDDLRAIYRYLRTVPSIDNDVPERDRA